MGLWAEIPDVVSMAALRLQKPERLDSEGARDALVWFLQLGVASCEARAQKIILPFKASGDLVATNVTEEELNTTLTACKDAVATVNLAQAFWPAVSAWNITGNSWRLRIQLYRAETLLAVGRHSEAMSEIIKAMSGL